MQANLALYTAEQTRALDRAAIDDHGIPGGVLMQRAGAACFRSLQIKWPGAHHLTVVCGSGNNGGDGFVIAHAARQAGLVVRLLLLGQLERLDGDAAKAAQVFVAAGGQAEPWRIDALAGPDAPTDLIVDAMLGTGLDRPLRGDYLDAVQAINTHPAPVLAVDLPTGLHADTGAVLGRAVRARLTVTFIGRKRGLTTGAALDHVGQLQFDGLDVPPAIYQQVPSGARLLNAAVVAGQLGPRPSDSHKGQFGSVLVVGGDHGMPGAVCLAGEAALRAGAGLVKVATRPAHVDAVAMRRPELMGVALEQADQLAAAIDWASVLAVGPGLGRSEWSRALLETALASDRPLVLDADALNLLAEIATNPPSPERRWILTPHPGEAARLLKVDTSTVQADRFAAATQIAEDYRAVCVLKGAGTVIASPSGGLRVVAGGNPGMATAGMGDVLTGLIAGLLGQGLTADVAADIGSCAHAAGGDRAVLAAGQRGLIAGDLLAALGPILG